MTVNVSPTPNLPPMPSNEQELLQWAQWLSTALNNYFKIAYEDINTAGSQYLFKSVTDGVNTYTATSPDDVLTLAAAGGQTISVDPATGTMTFTSAAGGDFDYVKTGDELNALAGMSSGEVCFVTLNSTGGTARYKGMIYQYDGANWNRVDALYSTTITAGQISLTSITNLSLANLDAAADAKLSGISPGADVTTTVLSSTVIEAGKINLSTSTFDGVLGLTYTEAGTTYRLTGTQLNALTGMKAGDTCFVTVTYGSTYYANMIYRYSGSAWELSGFPAYRTAISAGKIALASGDAWHTGVYNVPTRFGDSMPTSGSGLVMTATELGYYKACKKATGTLTGTLTRGTHVTQLTTGAIGIILDLTSGSTFLWIDVLSGTFSGSGASYRIRKTSSTGNYFQPDGTYADAIYNTCGFDSNGRFYFSGNATNYISWDGSLISIICSGGYIGSTSNYFDITNGRLHLESAADADTKVEAYNGYYASWHDIGGSSYLCGYMGSAYVAPNQVSYGGFFRQLFVCGFNGAEIPDSNTDMIVYAVLRAYSSDNGESKYFIMAIDDAGDSGYTATIEAQKGTGNNFIKGFKLYSEDATLGATGSFVDNGGNTVTVKNGLITAFT
jgi:hypothetical protein